MPHIVRNFILWLKRSKNMLIFLGWIFLVFVIVSRNVICGIKEIKYNLLIIIVCTILYFVCYFLNMNSSNENMVNNFLN